MTKVTARRRKPAYLLSTLLLASSFLLVTVSLPTPFTVTAAYAAAKVLCVNVSGGMTGDPCDNRRALTTIQAAVTQAAIGDEIRIANGIYTSSTGASVVSFSGKPLMLQGGFDGRNWNTPIATTATIIDGQAARRGIEISGSDAIIAGLIIRNGKGSDGGGIAVTNNWGNTVYLFDTTIINNVATGSGGGLFVTGSTYLNRTKINNNRAGADGGGFYGYELEVIDSEINSNTGMGSGGAAANSVTLTNTKMQNNTATKGGGGALSIYGNATISGAQISDNIAGANGGGLIQFATDGKITIMNSSIERNRAFDYPDDIAQTVAGGGLSINGSLRLDNTRIKGNVAQGDGGGVYQWNLNGRVDINDSVIEQNTASTGAGGGVRLGGSAALTNTLVLNNTAKSDGGGLYQATFSNGRPKSRVSVAGGLFQGNIATNGNGGGLYIDDDGILNWVRVVSNRANGSGGGLHQADGKGRPASSLTIANSIFDYNMAESGTGGGLHVGGIPTIKSARIVGNTAGLNGGGVYILYAPDVLLSGTLIGNNRASNSGDGVYIDNYFEYGEARLINVTVASNQRSPNAAIQMQGSTATLNLVNTAIVNHAVGISRATGSTLNGNYNAFYGNGTDQVVNNIATALPFTEIVTADPQFTNPIVDDFHILENSPLRNAGDPRNVYTDQFDFEGQPVPLEDQADIGADEFFLVKARVYLPLTSRRR